MTHRTDAFADMSAEQLLLGEFALLARDAAEEARLKGLLFAALDDIAARVVAQIATPTATSYDVFALYLSRMARGLDCAGHTEAMYFEDLHKGYCDGADISESLLITLERMGQNRDVALELLGALVEAARGQDAAPDDVPPFLAHRIEAVTAPRHGSYWTREEAYAVNDVQLPLCIHGEPRNVFCGKCES